MTHRNLRAHGACGIRWKVMNDKDQRESKQTGGWGAGKAEQGGQKLRAMLPLSLGHPPAPCLPISSAHNLAPCRPAATDAPSLAPPRLGGLPQQVQQRVLHGPRVPGQVPLRGHHRGLLQPEAGPCPKPPPRIRHRPVSAAQAGAPARPHAQSPSASQGGCGLLEVAPSQLSHLGVPWCPLRPRTRADSPRHLRGTACSQIKTAHSFY